MAGRRYRRLLFGGICSLDGEAGLADAFRERLHGADAAERGADIVRAELAAVDGAAQAEAAVLDGVHGGGELGGIGVEQADLAAGGGDDLGDLGAHIIDLARMLVGEMAVGGDRHRFDDQMGAGEVHEQFVIIAIGHLHAQFRELPGPLPVWLE